MGVGVLCPPAAQMWDSFQKWAHFAGFLCFLKKCIDFKPLVYANLFFAAAAVSCKALLKGFLNGTTCIAKIVSLV